MIKFCFPLAEERNNYKLKMFPHTPLEPGFEGLFFESHAQCYLSVAFLLSAIADIYFEPSADPLFELITYTL